MGTTIYKYRTWGIYRWENLIQRRAITNNELFFASPNRLNDPKELINMFHFENLDYEDKIKFIASIIRRAEPYLAESEIYKRAKGNIDIDAATGFNFLKKHGRTVTKEFRKIVGIFSTSNTSDNHHMWVNYANNYFGYCVGYDFEELREYLSKGLGSFGGEVNYCDQYPIIIPDIDKNLEDLAQLCFNKLRKWRPEDENRILKFKFANKTKSIPSSIIKEIIIGQNMLRKYKIKILKYIYRKYPICKLYVANEPALSGIKKAQIIEISRSI